MRRSPSVGIDLKAGALGIPTDIKKVGWWRDGAAPGADEGTILIGGHVDSAKNGAGAFYALKSARRGDIVDVDSRRYRVTSVKRVRKARAASEHLHAQRAGAARARHLRRPVRQPAPATTATTSS